jgi:hypothetical protein
MNPSQLVANHIHGQLLAQYKNGGAVPLRGLLSAEENATTLGVIKGCGSVHLVNMLSVKLSTSPFVTLETPSGRVDGGDTFTSLMLGTGLTYGHCITRKVGSEAFLIEANLTFLTGEVEPLLHDQDLFLIELDATLVERLLVLGLELGKKLAAIHRRLAEALCSQQGHVYGDPERFLWVDMQVDIGIANGGELGLENVRIRLKSNKASFWSEQPISLVGKIDVDRIVQMM